MGDGHEIFSSTIPSLPLIQVGLLSVTVHVPLVLVNRFGDQSLCRNSASRWTDSALDMTLIGRLDCKAKTNKQKPGSQYLNKILNCNMRSINFTMQMSIIVWPITAKQYSH